MKPERLQTNQIDGRLTSERHTAGLAAALAESLHAGDILLLSGPLGAGKSAFARALIQAAQADVGGPVEDVPSPSYTLVQAYAAGERQFVHADLYRLGSVDEITELGLDEAMEEAICLIEWPERLGTETPARALAVSFLPVADIEDAREVSIVPTGSGWDAVLSAARTVFA